MEKPMSNFNMITGFGPTNLIQPTGKTTETIWNHVEFQAIFGPVVIVIPSKETHSHTELMVQKSHFQPPGMDGAKTL